MGDYSVNINANVRALSPVDFDQLANNQSLFSPEHSPRDTMQDETLLEKSSVNNAKQQQLSSNNGPSGDHNINDSIVGKPKSEENDVSSEDKKNDLINSVASSLNQLGLSDTNHANGSNGTPVTSSLGGVGATPSFWSAATADDTFLQGFQTLNGVNGGLPYQNFSPNPNALFNANMPPQMGMNQMNVPPQQSSQRRAITGQHNVNFPQAQQQQQRQHQQTSLYMNNTNKTYPTWSSATQQNSWSQQGQTPMSPWNNIQQQQRRTGVPNMNPIGAQVRKNLQSMNSSFGISPTKFNRRTTGFPGHMPPPMGNKPGLDISNFEDNRDMGSLFGVQQVSE